MIKIAINGFGRIGRAFFRSAIAYDDMEVKYINEPSNIHNIVHLIKYDSSIRPDSINVGFKDNVITYNGRESIVTNFYSPLEARFDDIDIVVESSGKFLTNKYLQYYLQNGAKKVILSSPPKDNIPVFVIGVNTSLYNGEAIISNASCTSNAIAPIINAIKEKYRILGGNITTIHPFNNNQTLLDSVYVDDCRLGRNATLNIIPTKSSIGDMIGCLFNELQGKFIGDSIRVPTSLVSISNVDLLLHCEIKEEDILNLPFDNRIIGFDIDRRISSDFVGDNRSGVIPADLIKINGNMCRIPVWFDNESGYAARLVEMARFIYLNPN